MLQSNNVTGQIWQKLGILEYCLFLLGFLIGCLTTYGLITLRGHEKDSLQSQTENMLDFRTIDQYSPCLMQMLRNVIVPPSNLPYNLENGNREHSHGQAQLIKKLFKGKVSQIILIWVTASWYWYFQRKGFFIEAGALDGERGSNSLSLEKDLNWSGLLAEGDPSNIELIKYEITQLGRRHLPLEYWIMQLILCYFYLGQRTGKASCYLIAFPYQSKSCMLLIDSPST